MKFDWYQSDTHVVVNVLAKNCKPSDTVINITDDKVEVIHKSEQGEEDLKLDLFLPIDSQHAAYKILSTKIEIKLPKHSAERWASLQASDKPQAVRAPKNWDKIAVPEDEPQGDEALNKMFQKIYADADENTKRAMNKSYMESGGTVLSTSWNEVGAKKVEVKPPDGMEYKKWEC